MRAIILCAGKGTRMNDESTNKVCFKSAGVPVIKRIISNFRTAGIGEFVIVTGYKADKVKEVLKDEKNIIYAFQEEQLGTGDAVYCGLKELQKIHYNGQVVVSMGDKIISSTFIKELIEKAKTSKNVWCVQPLENNRNGGRVVLSNDKPYGIVEFADACEIALADVEPSNYRNKLKEIGLNINKIEKVINKVNNSKPNGSIFLNGKEFFAEEILNSKYANAGMYLFDLNEILEIIPTLNRNNAQGEFYITDCLERLASHNSVSLLEVKTKETMLTYSTKPELAKLSVHFLRNASEFICAIQNNELDEKFNDFYGNLDSENKFRYIEALKAFIKKYGDKKVIITRSPGRINLMGRHIDHRGGNTNVMATDKDTIFVCSPRDDDLVNMANVDSNYKDRTFSIEKLYSLGSHDSWLSYLDSQLVKEELINNKGDWSNYIKSGYAKVRFELGIELKGMDMMASGNIPPAAGLSSSSSLVVATMEAINELNCLNLSTSKFIDFCGEGEWYVGSRGGAGDHAAMKCSKKDKITQLGFKPFGVGEQASFSDRYAVLVANSMIKAKKSEGSKDKFNSKVASYEFALMMINRSYPEYNFIEFRDIAMVRPFSKIYEMVMTLPLSVTREEILSGLPEYKNKIEQLFSNHIDQGEYNLRGVALYGISECARASKFMEVLNKGDYVKLGEMMKISHNGDRIWETDLSDKYLQRLAEQNADIADQFGSYDCSTKQIDELVDLLNNTNGVLGSQLVGAGLGGCVVALVEKDKSNAIISRVNNEYYDKYGYEHSAHVYSASAGSKIIY